MPFSDVDFDQKTLVGSYKIPITYFLSFSLFSLSSRSQNDNKSKIIADNILFRCISLAYFAIAAKLFDPFDI